MASTEFRRVPSLFATSVILFFVGIFLFIALLTKNRELIILSLLVFVMIGGLKLWTRFAPAKIKSTLQLSKNRVFAGDTFLLKARIENAKMLPISLEVKVPFGESSRGFPREKPLSGQESLLWYQAARFEWSFTATKRGVYEIGPLRVLSGDLFGFFQQERTVGEIFEAIVYPRLVPLGPFSMPRRDFFGTPGGESPVDDPVYILGTTDYRNGRPAKYIHWKASARHYRLQEKVFESTEQEKIILIVDVDQFVEAEAEDEFEKVLEVVASVAVRLDRQGCSVGFLTNGTTKGIVPVVGVSRSPQQLTDILEALARLRMEPGEPLIDMLRNVEIPWGTSCLYFSLKENPSTDIVRAHLKRRKMPVVHFTSEIASVLRLDKPVDGTDASMSQNTPVVEGRA